MEDEIHFMTSSEWNLVQRRLDDLENLVADMKLRLEILGECKCNRSSSYSETQHSDDETETVIGINTQSNTSTPSGIIDIPGQLTTQSDVTDDILPSAGRDANNTADSASTSSTGSNLSDIALANTADNVTLVSRNSTLCSSNGIRIKDLEKYRRAQVKLKRCDQVEVMGTSSSECGIAKSKSRLTSNNKESHISSKKCPLLRLKGKGVRGAQVSTPPLSDKKRFVCHICQKRFGGMSNLTTHIRVHTGVKPFSCNICSKTFTQAAHLKSHTRVHTQAKPFECGFCSKKFSHKHNLATHTRVHTGMRPFECGFCSNKYCQSGHLVMHMRSHTGERPYTCQFCSRGFALASNLEVHLRVHTREKPYSCPICPKVFAQRIHLKGHLKRHPGETPLRQGQIQDEGVP